MAIEKVKPNPIRTKEVEVNKAVDQIIRAFQGIYDIGVFIENNGDIVISKDIHCRSLYVKDNSIFIGGVKIQKPKDNEDGYYLQYDQTNKKITYQSTTTPTTETVQDIAGAMFTGNTETLITATYQDSDGTIDLVVDEANIDHDALTNAHNLTTDILGKIVCNAGDVITNSGEVVWVS